jgi:hypothetical protein
MLYSPHRDLLPQTRNYIVDNGAYRAYLKGENLNLNHYFAFLGKLMKCPYPPQFVVIPDMVAGGMDSWEFSMKCIGKIPEQFKKYFVVQDGMYQEPIRQILPAIDGLFVGGTTIWKWRTAENWIELAHMAGKKCHIGRVGTWRNFLRAVSIGADSIDGSTLMRHRRLEQIEKWREEIRVQKLLEKEDWMMSTEAAVYSGRP